MAAEDPDVVVVGGGIAGASMAVVLARAGVEVLLLERQEHYRDRVRGEFMSLWGVWEARTLGVEPALRSTQAVDLRFSVAYDELRDPSAAEAARADLSTVLPGVAGALGVSHPKACQALADEAQRAGANVLFGVTGVRVRAGPAPAIEFIAADGPHEVRPRLLIGADGRGSTVRKQAGISMNEAPPRHVIAGLLVEGASTWPQDHYSIGVEGDLLFYVFPQGADRLRLYTCHANEQATRWAGSDGAQHFLDAVAARRSLPPERPLHGIAPAGPCATFSCEQTWCEEPFADGVVLVGDAGGYDNPVDGQGLSLAMSDVRHLSELLLSASDWTVTALSRYGLERTERLRRMRRVSTTFAALRTTFTAEGRARRERIATATGADATAIRTAFGAVNLGPDRVSSDAFADDLHEAVLAL